MDDEIIKIIWTIGYSICTLEELIEVMDSFQIKVVVDIRSYPSY